jgi:hypothetical protein
MGQGISSSGKPKGEIANIICSQHDPAQIITIWPIFIILRENGYYDPFLINGNICSFWFSFDAKSAQEGSVCRKFTRILAMLMSKPNEDTTEEAQKMYNNLAGLEPKQPLKGHVHEWKENVLQNPKALDDNRDERRFVAWRQFSTQETEGLNFVVGILASRQEMRSAALRILAIKSSSPISLIDQQAIRWTNETLGFSSEWAFKQDSLMLEINHAWKSYGDKFNQFLFELLAVPEQKVEKEKRSSSSTIPKYQGDLPETYSLSTAELNVVRKSLENIKQYFPTAATAAKVAGAAIGTAGALAAGLAYQREKTRADEFEQKIDEVRKLLATGKLREAQALLGTENVVVNPEAF